MAHWLFKTEPGSWSWDQQLAAGREGTFWSGVRNHQAKRHLMAMQPGEQGFFYHSGSEKRILGIVEVTRAYYPDHTDPSGAFGMVDVRAAAAFARPVTLAEIRAEPQLKDMVLVNNSRLSVQPVSDEEWELVCAMGGVRPL